MAPSDPRAAVCGLDALTPLTSLTSVYVFGHVDVLANPELKALAPHERPGFGSPEVASEWSVMALPQHLLA